MPPSARYVAGVAAVARMLSASAAAAEAAAAEAAERHALQLLIQSRGNAEHQSEEHEGEEEAVWDEEGEWDGGEDEEEGEDYASPIDDQWEDYEDNKGPDMREARGWQVLDRCAEKERERERERERESVCKCVCVCAVMEKYKELPQPILLQHGRLTKEMCVIARVVTSRFEEGLHSLCLWPCSPGSMCLYRFWAVLCCIDAVCWDSS